MSNAPRCVTVARDGARLARTPVGPVPVYCTAVYTALPRKRDGKLTWRRTGTLGDRTSGRKCTQNMARREMARAAQLGLEFRPTVRHGDPAPY